MKLSMVLKCPNILFTYDRLKKIDFGCNPVKLKQHIEQLLDSNDIKYIVILSVDSISPSMIEYLCTCCLSLISAEQGFMLLRKIFLFISAIDPYFKHVIWNKDKCIHIVFVDISFVYGLVKF